MEKQINQEVIYEGKVLNVYKDQVEIDGQHLEYREIINHNGGVCVAIEDEDHTYFLVKQFRYAFNDYLIEFPAGKLEKNENHYDAMIREAKEEIGCEVKDIIYENYFIPTCGYSNEKIYLYSAKVKSKGEQALEVGEDITVLKFTLEEIMDKIKSGEIVDGKTIILAYKLYNK